MPSSTSLRGSFDSIPDCIEAYRNGEFIVVLDDPGRENEGDLAIASQFITTEQMAFLIRHTSGYICCPVTAERCEELELPHMVPNSQDPRQTAYTVTVDAIDDSMTTGISAHDRALTCRMLADPKCTKDNFRRPGHMLPLRYRPGGVRVRGGHTESSIDFCRLAGLTQCATIAELVVDGDEVEGQAILKNPEMMRGENCIKFARKYNLKVCTTADLLVHIEKNGNGAFNGSSSNGSP